MNRAVNLAAFAIVIGISGCLGIDSPVVDPPKVTPAKVTLTIARAGEGAGEVTFDPAGGTYEPGTTVTLTATAVEGSRFRSWGGGGCLGSEPTCTLTLKASTSVVAAFDIWPVGSDSPRPGK